MNRDQPSFAQLFTPKLITILREGYSFANFKSDALAGLTVAIVALPLSMAIAIASGASPAQGLYTAIFGGVLVSALGGSRFQIGGPAGAFIVLVAATVARHGMDGLLIAVMLSGIMLLAVGYLQLGTYIKFIPYPVTVGFTAGIAVIIFASQIKDLFGLALPGAEPGNLIPKLVAFSAVLNTINPASVVLAVGTIVFILGLQRIRPHWPGMLFAVVLTGAVTWYLKLPVETISSKFGGISSSLPMPTLPQVTWEKIRAALPDAMAFTLLGAIESLLSAVVADSMTGRRHRSNCELVAQGFANICSALFGGICVTGTIARTATNVRAGAHGPISGMLHSLFLLIFILVAAPLAGFIPLAALAGILAVVAWKMVDKGAFSTLVRASMGDAIVLLATFLITVFRDLTTGIVVGFTLGTLLFLDRMSRTTRIETAFMPDIAPDDRADSAADRTRYDAALASDPNLAVYRISGAFFFGAAASIGSVLDRIADRPKTIILDFSAVPFLDSTGANTVAGVVAKAQRHGSKLILTGVATAVRKDLMAHGVHGIRFENSVDAAIKALGHA